MLQEIIKNEDSQKLLKILLKTQLTCIISYPSYEILACSDELSFGKSQVGKKPREMDHSFAKFSKQHASDTHQFRLNGISSKWLVIFKRETLSSLELFQMDDIPIFHNNHLIGICCIFKNIVINDLHLINKLLNINEKNGNLANITNNELIMHDNSLSVLEKEILFFAALNKSNKQISSLQTKLGIRDIGYNTIKATIRQRIYQKLDTMTIDDAVVKAIETKQIDKVPESILAAMLKDYYLIETEKGCIEL